MLTDTAQALPVVNQIKPKIGRPAFAYTDEIAAEILALIASGLSLSKVCERDGMPGLTTVWKWLQSNESFAIAYGRAREEQAEKFVDELVSLADSATNENWKPLQLKIDTRKWVASKLKPRTYGERQQVDVTAQVTLRALILEATAGKPAPKPTPVAQVIDNVE
jgi:hypothetical protein